MRRAEWFRRAQFSTVSKAGLGWGAEYWVRDADAYEGSNQLRDRLRKLGRKDSRAEVVHILSNDLLSEVLVAAGGVEHSVLKFREAIGAAQEVLRHDAPAESPSSATGLAHPSVEAPGTSSRT